MSNSTLVICALWIFQRHQFVTFAREIIYYSPNVTNATIRQIRDENGVLESGMDGKLEAETLGGGGGC